VGIVLPDVPGASTACGQLCIVSDTLWSCGTSLFARSTSHPNMGNLLCAHQLLGQRKLQP